MRKAPTKIESCTQHDVELHATQVFVISQSEARLPLLIEDAMRPENEVYLKFLLNKIHWNLNFPFCAYLMANISAFGLLFNV